MPCMQGCTNPNTEGLEPHVKNIWQWRQGAPHTYVKRRCSAPDGSRGLKCLYLGAGSIWVAASRANAKPICLWEWLFGLCSHFSNMHSVVGWPIIPKDVLSYFKHAHVQVQTTHPSTFTAWHNSTVSTEYQQLFRSHLICGEEDLENFCHLSYR